MIAARWNVGNWVWLKIFLRNGQKYSEILRIFRLARDREFLMREKARKGAERSGKAWTYLRQERGSATRSNSPVRTCAREMLGPPGKVGCCCGSQSRAPRATARQEGACQHLSLPKFA